jgi:hypothetical protein
VLVPPRNQVHVVLRVGARMVIGDHGDFRQGNRLVPTPNLRRRSEIYLSLHLSFFKVLKLFFRFAAQ